MPPRQGNINHDHLLLRLPPNVWYKLEYFVWMKAVCTVKREKQPILDFLYKHV